MSQFHSAKDFFFYFLGNLLGWHWLITLHRFQLNNSIHHLYIVLCSPPQVRSPSITMCPPTTLSYLPLPFSADNHHTVVCVYESFFVCLIPLPLSLIPQPLSPLTAVSLFSVSMSLSLFCSLDQFVPQIPHMSEIIWYLSFSDWLISHSIMLSRSIYVAVKNKISFSFMAK